METSVASPNKKKRRRSDNLICGVTEQDDTLQKQYQEGDIVWVRKKPYPWWPAEIIDDNHITPLMYQNRRKPVAVKYIGEEEYTRITEPRNICRYDCPDKEAFKIEGLRSKFKELFKHAVKLAEIKLGIQDEVGIFSVESREDLPIGSKTEEMSSSTERKMEEKLATDSEIVETELSWDIFPAGTTVWVKLAKLPWWPAKVGDLITNTKKPGVCVNFFNEDYIEIIKDIKKLKVFNCPDKQQYFIKGQEKLPVMEKKALFTAAFRLAEEYCLTTTNHHSDNETIEPMLTTRDNTNTDDSRSGNHIHEDGIINSDAIKAVSVPSDDSNISGCLSFNCGSADITDSVSVHHNHRDNGVEVSNGYENISVEVESQTSDLTSIKQLDGIHVTNEMKKEESVKTVPKICDSKKKLKNKGIVQSDRMIPSCETCDKSGIMTTESEHEDASKLKCSLSPNLSHSNDKCKEDGVKKFTDIKSDAEKDLLERETNCSEKENHSNVCETVEDVEEVKCSCPVGSQSSKSQNVRGRRARKRKNTADGNKKRHNKKRKFGEKSDDEVENSGHIQKDLDDLEIDLPVLTSRSGRNKPKKDGKPKRKKKTTLTKKQKKSKTNSQSEDLSKDSGISYTEGSSPVPLNYTDIDHQYEAQSDLYLDESGYLPTPSRDLSDFRKRADFDPNLDADDFDSSGDDEVLPDILTPSRQSQVSIPQEHDLVWVKWKRCPVWPAVVKKITKKKRRLPKISLLVVEPLSYMPQRLPLNYNASRIIPYESKDSEKILEEGSQLKADEKEKFEAAVEIVNNYLTKKILGTLRNEDVAFMMPSGSEIDDSFYQSPTPSPEANSEDSNQSVIITGVKDGEKVDIQTEKRYERIKEKNKELVKFCQSVEVKQYLTDIILGKRKSTKHYLFHRGTSKEKDGLKNAGFGPIADEEQQEELISTMLGWYKKVVKFQEGEVPDINYVIDVLVPEAVVYGLIKLKKYARKKAWKQFEKGVYMTKKEKEEIHRSLIEGAKKISPEDVQRYDEKFKERFNFLCENIT